MKIKTINVGQVLFLILLVLRCNILISANYALKYEKYPVNITYYNYHPHHGNNDDNVEDRYLSFSRRVKRPNNRIAGGYPIEEGEFPSFVGLVGISNDFRAAVCSGVAIGDKLILTAAHCFHPHEAKWNRVVVAPGIYRPDPLDVRYGLYSHIYYAEKSCRSSLYDPKSPVPVHDYMILRLKKSIPGIELASLAATEPRIGAEGIAVGTGIQDNSEDPPIWSDRAQALPVARVACENRHSDPSHICFKSFMPQYTGDTCQGDSGGPIYMTGTSGRQVVVGLTSFGDVVCRAGHSGVSINANVYNGMDEIHELIERCS